jgi:hypothetical protein
MPEDERYVDEKTANEFIKTRCVDYVRPQGMAA